MPPKMESCGVKMLAASLTAAFCTPAVHLLKHFKFMRKISKAQVQATKCASCRDVLFTSSFCGKRMMSDVGHQMMRDISCHTCDRSE